MVTLYRSTRDASANSISSSQAVLQGISPDGGLFVPVDFPKLDLDLSQLPSLSYQELAYKILQPFFSDFTEDELRSCINSAYGSNFTSKEITPVSYHAGNIYLELFHGPTIAFKDVALQLLPYLLITSAKKNNSNLKNVILTATSGDTGKAAMAGFADVENTQIIVFYPKYGVSPIQEKQMLTQTGKNVYVVGITGNFDNAQTNVKQIFNNSTLTDELLKSGYQFSSANSINIGRLLPQIVYYFYAYGRLLADNKIKLGDKINFSVPTGNFGDILAGFFAKKLGLPINKLLCASNENNVLTEFFKTGTYNKKRDFKVTNSPSMDILVSSNLERLLFYATNGDAALVAEWMNQLEKEGKYTVNSDTLKFLQTHFYAGSASQTDTKNEIKQVFTESNYAIDPHTAVASFVTREYKESTNDLCPIVTVSTASPYKFPQTVLAALGVDNATGDLDDVKKLVDLIKLPLPKTVANLFEAKQLHNTVIEPDEMEKYVKELLI